MTPVVMHPLVVIYVMVVSATVWYWQWPLTTNKLAFSRIATFSRSGIHSRTEVPDFEKSSRWVCKQWTVKLKVGWNTHFVTKFTNGLYWKSKAGPSVIRLEGAEPGILDKSQRSRLMRHPHSKLSFATFDPYTATPRDPSDISKLSLDDEKCRPKRIVIEMVPRQGSFWRWVPSARRQDGVGDEGVFPRLVEICGYVNLSLFREWHLKLILPFKANMWMFTRTVGHL